LLLGGGAFLCCCAPLAEEFPLPEDPGDTVVGAVSQTSVRKGESLLDIARAFDLGHDQIVLANPKLNRWVPAVGAAVRLPARYVLPPGPRRGLVLNLAELRLYYFPPRSGTVITHPVSVGDIDWRTPRTTTYVAAKVVDPAWRPPPSIRAEHRAEGEELPESIPGGAADNPLGHFALKLGIPAYLIHGTDERRAFGIGMRVSHGCIRLYPEDIESLFPRVPVGTTVRIIDVPIKAGWRGELLYLEVHRPLEREEQEALPPPSFEQLEATIAAALRGDSRYLDTDLALKVFARGDGVATPIGRRS